MVGVTGCALTGKGKPAITGPITLEFSGRPGEVSENRYSAKTRTLKFEGSQLTRDHTEAVDFSVRNHVSSFDREKKLLKFELTTLVKDGTIPLHDMAFPELNEQIDFTMRTNGQIVRAGRFSTNGIFYVPALPIPGKPVQVGDTWTLTHTWQSGASGIPIRLDVIGILKGIVTCEKSKICADMELSGTESLLVAPATKGGFFTSRMSGRLLFSLERGDVIWSEMHSQETMGYQNDRTEVTSCMVSEMKVAATYQLPLVCDPSELVVKKIPDL